MSFQEEQADASAPKKAAPEAPGEPNWLNKTPQARTPPTPSSRMAVGLGGGSQLANEGENQYLEFINTVEQRCHRGSGGEKCLGWYPGNAAAARRQPVGPPQIQLFPGNGNPSSHPRRPTTKRVRGCKSRGTAKLFRIHLSQSLLRPGFYI